MREAFAVHALIAFSRLRAEFVVMMAEYGDRLAADVLGAKRHVSEEQARNTRRRNRVPVATVFTRMRLALRDVRRLVAVARGQEARPNAVIATATSRLGGTALQGRTLRSYMGALTAPVRSDRDPGVAAAIMEAPSVIISDAVLLSPQRDASSAAEDAPVVIDGVLLACFFVIGLLRADVRPCVALLSHWRAYRRVRREERVLSVARDFVTAAMVLEGYRHALGSVGAYRLYLLTSNNFITELLRFHALTDRECLAVCEVMHGIPTVIYERYLRRLLDAAASCGWDAKHWSVPQIPDVPKFGVLERDVRLPSDFAINAYLNRYWLSNRTPGVTAERWYRETLGAAAAGAPVVICFIGGATPEPDPRTSRLLAIECSLVEMVAEELAGRGRAVALLYAPHPIYGPAPFGGIEFFRDRRITVVDDTALAWMLADGVVGLLSSALFEAHWLGVPALAAIAPEDDIYPPAILGLIHHQQRAGREPLMRSISDFVTDVLAQPPQDLRSKADTRATLAAGRVERVPS